MAVVKLNSVEENIMLVCHLVNHTPSLGWLIANKIKKTPWLYSSREEHRPSDRRLSAKLVPTFEDKGMSRSQRDWSPTAVFLALYMEPLHFVSSSSSIVLTSLSGPRSRPTTSQKIW
jgi:hypothetical protein